MQSHSLPSCRIGRRCGSSHYRGTTWAFAVSGLDADNNVAIESTCQHHHSMLCLFVCLVGLPVLFCLSEGLSACLPVYLFVSMPVCLSVCLHVCLSACLSACLSVCLHAVLPACLAAGRHAVPRAMRAQQQRAPKHRQAWFCLCRCASNCTGIERQRHAGQSGPVAVWADRHGGCPASPQPSRQQVLALLSSSLLPAGFHNVSSCMLPACSVSDQTGL